MTKAFPRVLLGLATSSLLLAGCGPANPSINLLGSYFPSWMLCGLIGVIAAALLHAVLSITAVDEFIPVKLLAYASIAGSLAFAVWLAVFAN